MTRTLTFCFLCGGASAVGAQTKDTLTKSGAAGTVAPAPAPQAAASQWLAWDAATSTATFKLVAGAPGAKSPFNFNGYTDGEAALVVPPGAHVVVNFVNEDGTPHSAEVINDGKAPIPNMGGDPAIPAAYTRDVTQGLPQFGKDVMRFTVPDQAGEYRIFCGVPGHGLSGMWIWLRVDPAVKAASFGPTKR